MKKPEGYRSGPRFTINVENVPLEDLKRFFPEAYIIKIQAVRPGVKFLRYEG